MNGHHGAKRRRPPLVANGDTGYGSMPKMQEATGKIRIFGILCIVIGILVTAAAGGYLIYYFLEGYPYNTDVKLSYGTLRGEVARAPYGKEVRKYLGIPYAKPPVGYLRFANPEELDKFPKDPYVADDYKYSCMQFLDTTYGDFRGSNMWNAPNPLREDCLYMNIWVPMPAAHNLHEKRKWPVMVWIYGGGFYGGSSALDLYDGTALASIGQVIVVSFNYRTGSFGFLTSGDGRLEGNYGMMDQVLALQWVKKNIKHFDGDPDKITVFGESAGAASIGFHLLSPISNNLFSRAILQSGGPDSRWSFMTSQEAQERSRVFLEAVNCDLIGRDDLLECLRNLDADTILNNEWVDGRYMLFPWVPSIDGTFLTDTPANLVAQGQLRTVDAILGTNAHEGTFFNLYSLPGLSRDDPYSYHNFTMFLEAEQIINWDITDNQRNAVIQFYVDNQIIDTSDLAANRDATGYVSGDRLLTCPTKAFAEDLINADSTKGQYMYYLSYRTSNEVWPEWMGVIHGAELQWIFGAPYHLEWNFKEREKDLSKAFITYFANFAYNGNPNDNRLYVWPKTTPTSQDVLEFVSPNIYRVQSDIRNQFCEFWRTLWDITK